VDLADRGGTEEENQLLDEMQTALGPLDDDTRRIRAQIAALEFCDSGFSLTVEELLSAIGCGKLAEPSCRPGCCWDEISWWQMASTQPGQVKSMGAIQAILKGYLGGISQDELSQEYPYARRFIARVHDWLGPRDDLADYQQHMIERILLPFELWAGHSRTGQIGEEGGAGEVCTEDMEVVGAAYEDGFAREDGRGKQLDAKIATEASLPHIYDAFDERSRETVKGISDPRKRELYWVCAQISEGAPNVCDCNHPTFRRIENWIHGIGRGTSNIATHDHGALRRWLDHIVFAYALALDKWLLDVPMQFLLLDLEHTDLGFNPRSKVLRVYKSLGQKTPVKEWLAATLWVALNGDAYGRAVFKRALELGISAEEWMDRQLADNVTNQM